MTSDAELDRILGLWLAEGGERAPQRDVDAALARVGTTRQRRPSWSDRGPAGVPRWAWVAAAALLVASLGFALAAGAGLVRLPWAVPQPPVPPAPAVVDVVPLTEITIEDRASRVSVPDGWDELDGQCCDYREFAGTDPEGHLSVGHESPYTTSICVPECHLIEMPLTIPYSADRQIDALRTRVADVLGSEAWEPLAAGVLPELERGARLEAVGEDDAGRSWRRVVIVGLRDRNVAAIAWSQPDDAYDPALLDAVLAAMELPSAPVYTDGDLIDWDEQGPFMLRVPGFWWTAEQPTLDGVGLSGAYRFGDGNVFVSIGSEDGMLGWCEPVCARLTGLTSLDATETAIRAGRELGPSSATTLGGLPARQFATAPPAARRYVVAMHGTRPVALLLDEGEWDVAPGIAQEVIGSLEFRDPVVATPSGITHITGGGRVQLVLPEAWMPTQNGGSFVKRHHRLTVRVGTRDGTIATCGTPAGPWELCREIQATTLEELDAAVQPGPLDDHGVGPPTGRREEITLDGEPAVLVRIQAYEYPAQSGQEVAYVVAIHDGRPVILRVWTSQNQLSGLDEIIAGFSFIPGS